MGIFFTVSSRRGTVSRQEINMGVEILVLLRIISHTAETTQIYKVKNKPKSFIFCVHKIAKKLFI